MPRRSFELTCSLARSLEIVGERWSFLVLRDLWVLGPRRFDQLQRGLKIARNILADRLETLIEGGVVERRLYQTRPDRYEYVLTKVGEELVPVMHMISAWGDRHVSGASNAPMVFRHKDRDHLADPVTVCRCCREELSIDELEPLPGPGAPKRVRRQGAKASA